MFKKIILHIGTIQKLTWNKWCVHTKQQLGEEPQQTFRVLTGISPAVPDSKIRLGTAFMFLRGTVWLRVFTDHPFILTITKDNVGCALFWNILQAATGQLRL